KIDIVGSAGLGSGTAKSGRFVHRYASPCGEDESVREVDAVSLSLHVAFGYLSVGFRSTTSAVRLKEHRTADWLNVALRARYPISIHVWIRLCVRAVSIGLLSTYPEA